MPKAFAFHALVTMALLAGCNGAPPTRPEEPTTKPLPPTPASFTSEERARLEALEAAVRALQPLNRKLPPPMAREWRAFWTEKAVPLRQYAVSYANEVTAERRVLYLCPLGKFTGAQHRMLKTTASFLKAYFQLETRLLPRVGIVRLPPDAVRKSPDDGHRQIEATYVTDKLLRAELPADAVAVLAITAEDLWMQDGRHTVFGQALLYGRAGVVSMYLLGTPGDPATRLRLLKCAAHETSHMFSITHTPDHYCVMNGRLSLAETDRSPLWFSPEGVAKLCWATGADPAKRFAVLAAWCREHGLQEEEAHWKKAEALVEQ